MSNFKVQKCLVELIFIFRNYFQYNSMTMGTTLRQKNRAALNQASKMVLDDMLRYLQSVYKLVCDIIKIVNIFLNINEASHILLHSSVVREILMSG